MKLLNPPVLRRDSSSSSCSSSSSSAKRSTYNPVSDIRNGCNRTRGGDHLPKRRDMTNIAPNSMFRKMDGFSNAEITDEVLSQFL